jgi:hypothetical protein
MFTDGLGYEGKVTLTLKSNNRVLKSQVYRNHGTARLFKFLGHCLINDFTGAKPYLPTKILLLYNEAKTPAEAITNAMNPTYIDVRSSEKGLSQMPTLISEDETEQVRVIYSFEMPKTAITGEFNQVALYSSSASIHKPEEFSAYYLLTDGANQWDPQNTVDWSATTILLIEWELILSNKNEANNKNTNGEAAV